MSKNNNIPECPLGGDNTSCKSCGYYPDFEWNNDTLECERNKNA